MTPSTGATGNSQVLLYSCETVHAMAGATDVCVLIPTLNEAETIGDVICKFQNEGFENILVVDGHSTDRTQEFARKHGARVQVQSRGGKGQAVREALATIDDPYVVLVDGDGTYLPEDAHRILEPVVRGQAEHVIGNRFANMEANAMTKLNQIGNRIINWAFRVIHGETYRDILSGFRAFTVESTREFLLTADGFGIETEFAVECVKHDVPVEVVPITYRARPGNSEPNLRPIRDGVMIALTLYRMAKTNNPMFYFGSIGVISWMSGIGVAVYVGLQWFIRGNSHEVLAIVAAFAILFGLQLVVFGVLSDMILSLHRTQMRRLK